MAHIVKVYKADHAGNPTKHVYDHTFMFESSAQSWLRQFNQIYLSDEDEPFVAIYQGPDECQFMMDAEKVTDER